VHHLDRHQRRLIRIPSSRLKRSLDLVSLNITIRNIFKQPTAYKLPFEFSKIVDQHQLIMN
jgi:hypothetical protein